MMMCNFTLAVLVNCLFTTWIYTNFVLSYETRVYEPTGCASAGAIWYMMPIQLHECLESCVRQTACLAVSYNRLSSLCVLRDSDLAPTTNGNCYHISMQDSITVLPKNDPCSLRPCNNRSMCESHDVSGSFSCRILYCDSNRLPDIPNARIASRDQTKVGFTNAYQCEFGYTMFGDSIFECMEGGNWSTPNLTCYKDCPSYIQKVGAAIKDRQGLRSCYNTTVTYSCINGYYNLTNTITSCLSNGTWSPFECLKYCTLDTIPQLNNGEATAQVINTINDIATYSCNPGFYKSTPSDSIVCYKDGSWQSPNMECWKFCTESTIPQIIDGVGTAGSINTIDEVATYTCNLGYYLSVATNTIGCLKTGVWETPTVECWKYCAQPTGPTHSNAEDTLLNQYKNDMEVKFTCTGDYYPSSDDRVTTCRRDGTWTTMTFSCNRYCGRPPIDVGRIISVPVYYVEITSGGGKEKYTTDDYVTYSCRHGSSIHGNNKRQCRGDGHWGGNIKCCIQIALVCTCCSSGSCNSDLGSC